MRYNIYDPPKAPFSWKRSESDNNAQRLVIGDKVPRFWIVGEVAKDGAWLIGKGNSALKQVSMAIYPIRAGEYNKWLSFLDELGGLRSTYPCFLTGLKHAEVSHACSGGASKGRQDSGQPQNDAPLERRDGRDRECFACCRDGG